MHRQSFQVPRCGHNQVWTDHSGTRFLTYCKRTSISARTERRRSHAMERSPSRAVSTLPTMVRRQLKRMRNRRYYCRLDQFSDILGIRAVRENLNVAQKCRGFFSPRRGAKWQRSGTAHEALERSTAETAHDVCKISQTLTLGSRVSRRESRTTQRRKVRSTCSET